VGRRQASCIGDEAGRHVPSDIMVQVRIGADTFVNLSSDRVSVPPNARVIWKYRTIVLCDNVLMKY
jgi:hypothetical protein